jgi:hypothetical protein
MVDACGLESQILLLRPKNPGLPLDITSKYTGARIAMSRIGGSSLPVSLEDATHSGAARVAANVIRAIEAQAWLMGLPQGDMPMPPPEKPKQRPEDFLARSPAAREALRRMLDRVEKQAVARSSRVHAWGLLPLSPRAAE